MITAVKALQTIEQLELDFGALNASLDQILMNAVLFSMNGKLVGVPRTPGVYAIFWRGRLVYVGSTNNIQVRNGEHKRRIIDALHLDINDCQFRFVACSKCASLSCEDYLISLYNPEWNRSGFGSKNSALFSQSAWSEKYGRTVPLLDKSLRLRDSKLAQTLPNQLAMHA